MHSNRIGGLGATYGVHLRLIGKLVGDFLLVIIKATPTIVYDGQPWTTVVTKCASLNISTLTLGLGREGQNYALALVLVYMYYR